MAAFLSQEWLDLTTRIWAETLDESGPSAAVQVLITGAPGPDTAYWWKLEDGRIRQAGTGLIETSGSGPQGREADVTLTQTYADAVAIQTGAMDLNALVMQGRVKVAGNLTKLMSVLPLTASSAFRELLRIVGAETDYPDAPR